MIRFLVLRLLLLLALPAVVQAQYIFRTNNGTITITQYTGPGGAVTIPDFINGLKVTTVGTAAFNGNYSVTSVTFGTNVTTIADNAIFQCYYLTSVSIPASVTNIGQGPFVDCANLVSISVSAANSHFTNVNQVLFNKSQTELIQFPGGVGGSYTVPATVTNVGTAFVGNILTSLSVNPANSYYTNVNGALLNKSQTQLISYPGALAGSFTVPSTVTTIFGAALEYCFGVSSVTIGTNVTSIGFVAFFDCPSLTAITVDPANQFYTSSNGVFFDKNKTVLIQYPLAIGGSYVIPSTVTNLADGAFGHALGLTSVVIPNSVTNIGLQTFYDCESLASVSIGNRVKFIAQSAFYYCPVLTAVVIPASVTSIGAYAFGYCQSLSSVCFEGNQPTDGGSIFYFDTSLTTILHVTGTTGWGATYDGIPTTPGATCGGGSAPLLAITRSGTNVIVTWPTNFTGYTLLSTTDLVSPAVWITNTPVPVVVNTNNAVTNSISGTRKFYRLSQ